MSALDGMLQAWSFAFGNAGNTEGLANLAAAREELELLREAAFGAASMIDERTFSSLRAETKERMQRLLRTEPRTRETDGVRVGVVSLRIEDTIEWSEAATVERATLHAELARLRRMADAYAKGCTEGVEEYDGLSFKLPRCEHCRRRIKLHAADTFSPSGEHIGGHAADCDVAIHLGLSREGQ